MVRRVRLAKSRELLGMRFPIEIAAVHDTTAYARGMAVHIFGRGVRDDVRSPFERTAIDRRGERIIDDQGYAMIMGDVGELLHVQYHNARIGDHLAEHRFRVRAERLGDLFLARVLIYERAFDSQLLQGDGQ